jgi:hypothetical protein
MDAPLSSVPLAHRRRMLRHLETTAPEQSKSEWGRSTGDARRLLARADRCWLAVRIGLDDHTFAAVSKAAVKRLLDIHRAHEPMPCELRGDRSLWIGTALACLKAEAAE